MTRTGKLALIIAAAIFTALALRSQTSACLTLVVSIVGLIWHNEQHHSERLRRALIILSDVGFFYPGVVLAFFTE